jgi:glycosyltransferase involved in cell wall biosynthesis
VSEGAGASGAGAPDAAASGPVHAIPVAFLVSTLATGGAERQLEHLLLNFDRARVAPRLYVLREPGAVGEALAAAGVPLASNLSPGPLARPWLPPLLAARFRRDGVRAVYCLDHTNAIIAGVLAGKLAGALPVLVAIHTMGQWDGASVPVAARLAMRGVTRVIAIAETQRRYLVESEGIAPERIAVIRNGIPPLDPAALPSKSVARAALGIAAEDRPVIGIVAMLRPEKAHEVFLEAARRVAERHPRAVFLVIGDGPRRRELEALAAGPGLAGGGSGAGAPGRVRFLGRRDDVPRILPALDLSVLSSHPRVETLPLSQMEAMSLAIPVVATRVGALEELVTDGVEGRLVPPGDPAAMAAAIAELVSDPARLRAAGVAARRKILAEFTIERATRETERLIVDCAGAGVSG